MDRFIETVVAIADAVGAEQGSSKRLQISSDEWSIWDVERYQAEDKRTAIDDWAVAPRILEDVYSVPDAVVFGNLMISLLKHGDRVTSACLAQLVNVIAPIMTEPASRRGRRPRTSHSRRRPAWHAARRSRRSGSGAGTDERHRSTGRRPAQDRAAACVVDRAGARLSASAATATPRREAVIL